MSNVPDEVWVVEERRHGILMCIYRIQKEANERIEQNYCSKCYVTKKLTRTDYESVDLDPLDETWDEWIHKELAVTDTRTGVHR